MASQRVPAVPTPSAQAIEALAQRSGRTAEHVMLAGDEFDEAAKPRSEQIRERLELSNELSRVHSSFTVYDDDFVHVRQRRGERLLRDVVLDLRYLDARPQSRFRSGRRSARAAFVAALIAGGAGAFAHAGIAPATAGSAAAAALLASAVAAGVCLRRTEQRISFLTRHGRAPALELSANVGRIGACRRVAGALSSAIERARGRDDRSREARLRAEIREHYRLADTGALSADTCSKSVRRALASFD